ncbi:hypothetical protein KSB_29050 [Ktedonobacter robiniae]|uniref:Uncharacterized protein n=1 Tax=Ktedonobacter robiniae TaxID=2778365 RepID=A0ABQ3UQ04_9CHLR|nr:hypothetical protein KSB_29050 [Ktedonobacter robiniae]
MNSIYFWSRLLLTFIIENMNSIYFWSHLLFDVYNKKCRSSFMWPGLANTYCGAFLTQTTSSFSQERKKNESIRYSQVFKASSVKGEK